MKKRSLILPLLMALVLGVSMTSCSDEYFGDSNTRAMTTTVYWNDWVDDGATSYLYAEVPWDAITIDVLNVGNVVAYVYDGDYQCPLPYVIPVTYTTATGNIVVPENISYKIKQMQSSYRLRDYPGSIDAGKQILQIDSIPAVASFIGDAYQHLNQPDSALCYYRQSLAWKPFNAAVVAKASNILIAKRDYDGALLQTQTYLESDPDNPVVAPIQGLAYYRKDDYDNAILVLQRQEDLGNDIYPVHFYLGQSYWQTEVIYRAEQEMLAAWQIDSSDVNLAYSIAVVKSDAFRSFDKEVKPWLDKVRDMLEPDPIMMSRLHHQYATGYYKLQESWDKAIEHYKESYRYNPKHISALSSIAYCYELKKDYKHALEWYEKYLKVATPGTKGYEFAAKSIDWLKAERFMEEK